MAVLEAVVFITAGWKGGGKAMLLVFCCMLTDRHLREVGKLILSVPSVMCGLVLTWKWQLWSLGWPRVMLVGCSCGQAAACCSSGGFPAGSVLVFLSTPFCFRRAVRSGSGELAFCFPKAVMSQGEQLQCVTKGEVPALNLLQSRLSNHNRCIHRAVYRSFFQ